MFVKYKSAKKMGKRLFFHRVAEKKKKKQKKRTKHLQKKESWIIMKTDTPREVCMRKEQIYQIFSHMPSMESARLLLRPLHVLDAEDMYDYARREDVTTYLLWLPHPSISYTRDYLSYIEERYLIGEFYDWAVVEKASGKMIGTCGFTRIDAPHNAAEIGYVLNPDFHGKGYGTEAAARVLRFGFEELSLHRIEAKFMQGNEASLRVMEKLGMHAEGYRRDGMLVKGAYRTIGICSILENEWRNKKDL